MTIICNSENARVRITCLNKTKEGTRILAVGFRTPVGGVVCARV